MNATVDSNLWHPALPTEVQVSPPIAILLPDGRMDELEVDDDSTAISVCQELQVKLPDDDIVALILTGLTANPTHQRFQIEEARDATSEFALENNAQNDSVA
jgi:hypothetical protein